MRQNHNNRSVLIPRTASIPGWCYNQRHACRPLAVSNGSLLYRLQRLTLGNVCTHHRWSLVKFPSVSWTVSTELLLQAQTLFSEDGVAMTTVPSFYHVTVTLYFCYPYFVRAPLSQYRNDFGVFSSSPPRDDKALLIRLLVRIKETKALHGYCH